MDCCRDDFFSNSFAAAIPVAHVRMFVRGSVSLWVLLVKYFFAWISFFCEVMKVMFVLVSLIYHQIIRSIVTISFLLHLACSCSLACVCSLLDFHPRRHRCCTFVFSCYANIPQLRMWKMRKERKKNSSVSPPVQYILYLSISLSYPNPFSLCSLSPQSREIQKLPLVSILIYYINIQ